MPNIFEYLLYILLGILLLIITIILIKLICDFINKYVIDFFFNLKLSENKKKELEEDLLKSYKSSSFSKQKKWYQNKNIELLLDVKDFYEKETTIFNCDFQDFMQKIEFVFKLFTFPIPIYSTIIVFLLKNDYITLSFECINLYIAIIVYLYFLIRIIYINSFQESYKTLQVDLPLKKSKSREIYLKNYIWNNAVNLKINKESLLRLKHKIKYIHVQFVACSLYLILSLMIVYTIQ